MIPGYKNCHEFLRLSEIWRFDRQELTYLEMWNHRKTCPRCQNNNAACKAVSERQVIKEEIKDDTGLAIHNPDFSDSLGAEAPQVLQETSVL